MEAILFGFRPGQKAKYWLIYTLNAAMFCRWSGAFLIDKLWICTTQRVSVEGDISSLAPAWLPLDLKSLERPRQAPQHREKGRTSGWGRREVPIFVILIRILLVFERNLVAVSLWPCTSLVSRTPSSHFFPSFPCLSILWIKPSYTRLLFFFEWLSAR